MPYVGATPWNGKTGKINKRNTLCGIEQEK